MRCMDHRFSMCKLVGTFTGKIKQLNYVLFVIPVEVQLLREDLAPLQPKRGI